MLLLFFSYSLEKKSIVVWVEAATKSWACHDTSYSKHNINIKITLVAPSCLIYPEGDCMKHDSQPS